MKTFLFSIFILLISGSRSTGQTHPQIAYQKNIQTEQVNSDLYADPVDTIGEKNEYEATVAVSEDKQVVLSYKDENGNGNLYISVLNENKWTDPEKLNKLVNTEGWEPNECISADGNWLYFTSKRAGGFGGKDIYRSEKLPNGEWSKGSNLGPAINTKYDEQAPVLLPDGSTLYFSSNGHKAVAGFNIFESSISGSGNWSEPLNVGYPVNKNSEETSSSTTTKDKKTIPPSIGENLSPEKSNCILTFRNKKEIPFTILKGEITGINGNAPKQVQIIVTDNKTQVITGYFISSDKTGHYSFMLPLEGNNNITYQAEGYLFRSLNIDLTKKDNDFRKTQHIQMSEIWAGEKITLNNVFFNPGTALINSTSNVELNNVIDLLNNNPRLVVKISDYMTDKENSKKNKTISQQRAQNVEEYLIANCINKNRLQAKGHIKYKSKKGADKKTIPVNGTNEWIELNILKN